MHTSLEKPDFLRFDPADPDETYRIHEVGN